MSKSSSNPLQAPAKGRICIRPYRDSDSEPIRALFVDAFGTGKGSILRAALKGQLADKLSMCLYTIGSISLCSQAIHLSTRYSSHKDQDNYNVLIYLGQAMLLAALATLLNRAYKVYLAVMKFIQLGLDGDMLDIGEHYCWRSLQFDNSDSSKENERRKNGYWVAELIQEDGSSIIVGGTGIGL
uniref:Uncharacterized protein n=1 Tax=Psilocybe cubensis TaxID=181762 RepID=A0A8H8CLG4_PSICU